MSLHRRMPGRREIGEKILGRKFEEKILGRNFGVKILGRNFGAKIWGEFPLEAVCVVLSSSASEACLREGG